MNIKMAGIEYALAPLEWREVFAFSSHSCAAAMRYIKEKFSVSCVLLSTCNRTELWISYGEGMEEVPSPLELLCRLKQAVPVKVREFIIEREGEKAVRHLLSLACGMKSKIFGEDQILSQVKSALFLAREQETADTVLEKLFQTAVTAAKKVKTEVKLQEKDTSVVEKMLETLRKTEKLSNAWREKRCLVIGNGQIGQLAARRLLEEGAEVTMTLRQYKDQSAAVPCGCKALPYQERMGHLTEFDVIVSGTSSPHYTLKYEETKQALSDGRKRILFDLAVPRDIAPELSGLPDLTLYNIDSFETAPEEKNGEQIRQAEEILEQYFTEFEQWYYFRSFVPIVYGIGRTAAVEIYKRLERPVRKLDIPEKEKAELEKTAKAAAETVVSSMLYGLREHLDKELWEECFRALENSIMK